MDVSYGWLILEMTRIINLLTMRLFCVIIVVYKAVIHEL